MRCLKPSRGGFSLIEVLVVVSLIALLAAFLLPALKNAREQAHSARCKAYVRQLGMGMTMYLQEFDCFPAHRYILRWYEAMAKLFNGLEVQGCPATPDWEVGRNNSYGFNYKFLGSARFNDLSPKRPFENFPVKAVRSPARTIAFGDADGTGRKKPYVKGVKDPDMLGNHGYTLDPTFIFQYSESTVNEEGETERYAWHAHRTYISTRHLGQSNACFADGHAETILPKQVYKNNRYWDGYGGGKDPLNKYVDYHYVDGEWLFPSIPAVQGH